MTKVLNKYNKSVENLERGKYKVKTEKMVRIRDALAHGRILALSTGDFYTLYKFSEAEQNKVQITHKINMDSEWFRKNIAFIKDELNKIKNASIVENLEIFPTDAE